MILLRLFVVDISVVLCTAANRRLTQITDKSVLVVVLKGPRREMSLPGLLSSVEFECDLSNLVEFNTCPREGNARVISGELDV